MDPLLQPENKEDNASRSLVQQAAVFLLHTVVALAAWAVVMVGGFALNQPETPQLFIFLACFLLPLVVGVAVNHFRQDQLAPTVWLIGLIWFLVLALRVLDMPTGPNACLQCDATAKITRTFFSFPSPSGLIDNDGPFLATWPAAALIGYSIGAKLALRGRRDAN
jgi:hypothetical protein